MSGNHGFADGNKRTTLILLHTLLAKSGYQLAPLDDAESLQDAAEQMIVDTVNHDLEFDDVTAWLKSRIRKIV
jgi:death-on-curing protein